MTAAKKCNRCGLYKPLTEYQKHPAARDGRKYNCNDCRAAIKRDRYANDPTYRERLKAVAAKWREANQDRHRAGAREWYGANQERGRAKALAWAAANPIKKRVIGARRRALQLKATPSWADVGEMELMYERATALGFEVDHIVPLVSKIVCGLHCPANLQALHKSVNSGKSNRHWPDMP